MTDFINQIFSPSVPFDQAINLIRQNRNFKSIYHQDNGYYEAFQSQINSFLSNPSKRVHGFLLVKEYLMEMPKDLLGDNFKNWAQWCVSYIEGSNWNGKNIALKLLEELLVIGHSDDNTRRKLSLHIVAQIVDYICRNNLITEKCEPYLVCNLLLTCVTKYSGSCGSKKYIINTFIIKNIYSYNEAFDPLTSILANIHYCPTPGQSNITTKNSWFDHFCAVINNMNSILDRFASWGVPFEDLEFTKEKMQILLNPFERETFIGRSKLDQSYKALAHVATKMLKDKNNCISIPVPVVLQLVARASSVKLGTLYVKDPCLAITILSVQLSSLRLLDQLIVTLKRSIVMFSRNIYQSLMGILDNATNINESSQSSTSSTSPQSKMCLFDLKNDCYNLLSKWFTITGPNVYIDQDVTSSLFKHFMTDMKLGEKQIELRNIKKEKATSGYTSSIPFMKDKLNSLNYNCLKAINSFIGNCFIFLPKEPLSFFASFVLEEVLTLYRNSVSLSPLYVKTETRQALLSLVVLLCQEDETVPLGIALNILQKVLSVDSSSQVREFCFEAMRSLNGTINPMKLLRVSETTSMNPFYGDAPSSCEIVENGRETVPMVVNSEDNQKEIENQSETVNQSDTIMKGDEQISDSALNKTNGTTDPVFDDLEADNELELEGVDETEKLTESNVIMIQDEDKVISVPSENGDCIVYDVESNDTVKTMKLDGGEKDDDLEIVDIKSSTVSIKRDADVIITSPSKKTKIIQEDSQSSSRSLTIIEPIEESGNSNTDPDIIKDFVAD